MKRFLACLFLLLGLSPSFAQFNGTSGIFALNGQTFGLSPTGLKIVSGGSGYLVGDTISLTCPAIGAANLAPGTVTVISTSSGAITSVAITTSGNYTALPSSGDASAINGVCSFTQVSTSGSGSGAVISTLLAFNAVLGPGSTLAPGAAAANISSSNSTLAISPPVGTWNQGFTVNQTGPATGSTGTYAYFNTMNINGDSYDLTNVGPWIAGLNMNYTFGGPNLAGARIGLNVSMFQTGTSTQTGDVAPFYTGISSDMELNGAAAVNFEQVDGFGSFINLQNTHHVNTLAGYESAITMATGTSVGTRVGFTSGASGEVQATSSDAAFVASSSSTTGHGWKNGLLISHYSGGDPLDHTVGCVICTDSASSTATGIDLSQYTFSGNFLKGPNGFSVKGSGAVVVNNATSLNTVDVNGNVGIQNGNALVLYPSGSTASWGALQFNGGAITSTYSLAPTSTGLSLGAYNAPWTYAYLTSIYSASGLEATFGGAYSAAAINGQLAQSPVLISALGTCDSNHGGNTQVISNGLAAPVYNATVSTTGTTFDRVFCNGTNWVYQ